MLPGKDGKGRRHSSLPLLLLLPLLPLLLLRVLPPPREPNGLRRTALKKIQSRSTLPATRRGEAAKRTYYLNGRITYYGLRITYYL